jgi:N-carbamoylputrescine amidase
VSAVAIAQLRLLAGEDDERIGLTVAAIESAADQGADLVVLPELAAPGYRLESAHLTERAETVVDGRTLGVWAAAARRRGVAVIGGFAERIDDGIATAAVVIDHTGAVVGRYRKLHLFGGEIGLFRPGDLGLPLFDLAGLRVGLLICYDLRFPEVARILALRGAQLLAIPTAWVPGFDHGPSITGHIGQVDGVIVQANLNQVFVACASQVGEDRGLRFLGSSVIVDPFGQVLCGPMGQDEVGVRTVEVCPSACERAWDRGPGISVRAQRRTDVYDGLLGYRDGVTTAPSGTPTAALPEDGHSRR